MPLTKNFSTRLRNVEAIHGIAEKLGDRLSTGLVLKVWMDSSGSMSGSYRLVWKIKSRKALDCGSLRLYYFKPRRMISKQDRHKALSNEIQILALHYQFFQIVTTSNEFRLGQQRDSQLQNRMPKPLTRPIVAARDSD